MSASLWPPPTKSMMNSGLRVPNQAVKAGSMCSRSEMRGRQTQMRTTPTRAGTRWATADQYGSNPKTCSSRCESCIDSGPYGLGVSRQTHETWSAKAPGRTPGPE